MDNVTELSSDVIRANLQVDSSDTLKPKSFGCSTRKDLLKETVSSEQLLSRPTLSFMAPEVASLITRNFVLHPTAQPSKNSIPDIETKRGADHHC